MSQYCTIGRAAVTLTVSRACIRRDIDLGYLKSYHSSLEPVGPHNPHLVDLDELRAFYNERCAPVCKDYVAASPRISSIPEIGTMYRIAAIIAIGACTLMYLISQYESDILDIATKIFEDHIRGE